jgi:DNA-directed RNA polymerase beta subunit
MKFKRFHALGPDGLANVGKQLSEGDIYVNKYVPVHGEAEYKSQPEKYKGVMPAYVDRMIITSTPDDPYVIKMI